MVQNVPTELAALRRMTPAELRDKYLEVFGETTRSGNKDFLFKRLAWRIQSLAEGTLSERAKQRAAELARDADIRMTMPKTPTTTPGAQASHKPTSDRAFGQGVFCRLQCQEHGRCVFE